MDISKLRKFAQFARSTLIDQVASRMEAVLSDGSAAQREHPKAFKMLEAKVSQLGSEQVVEQVAYIWFNRFTALRYLDVNGLSPVRVVSPSIGQFQPEILSDAKSGSINEQIVPEITRQEVLKLLDGRVDSSDPQGEAYRLLVVAACNYWHKALPFLFERIDDYTELLMPTDIQSNASILAYMREAMTPDVCKDVEIIGWLYQFYISEKKDQVFAGLKKNQKITAENIPAATQLFTPHWIVRYLVENSLGRLWLLNRPDSKLADQMDYYIAPEEPETDFLRISRPEDIRICDPAAGSGHMLTYAFDLLYAIYEEEGYDPTEIPALILTHNLTGVEIDDRAGALAAFALAMKAAAKLGRRRFLRMEAKPDICVLQENKFKLGEFNDFVAELGYDLNVDRVADRLTNVPLALAGIWKPVARYLKAAENPSFEASFETATETFQIDLAEETGLFEEASQNPFLLEQLKGLRGSLLAIASADEAQKERKVLEKDFAKTAQSPCISVRVAKIGTDYRKHKNDTTYRMELDVLIARAEEATESAQSYAKIETLGQKLVEAIAYHAPLWVTLKQFEQAKNFGSLIVPKLRDPAEALREVKARDFSSDLLLKEVQTRIESVLRMAEVLSPKYHVVVANPPYAGAKGLNPQLKRWLEINFPNAKSDLMTAFMVRSSVLCQTNGMWGMINLPSWMFLSSFNDCRTWLLSTQTVASLLQLGRGIFGSDFGSVAFVLRNSADNGRSIGTYRRLFEKHVQVRKPEEIEALFRDPTFGHFTFLQEDLKKIPGYPIAYWISKRFAQAFDIAAPFNDTISLRAGLSTGDNPTFQRQWYEVSGNNFDASRSPSDSISNAKWFPCHSGGEFRKWYGNHEVVLNWENDGFAIKNFGVDEGRIRSAVRNEGYYFRQGITWSKVSSGSFAARFRPEGFLFDDTGRCGFTEDPKVLLGGLGMFCSKVTNKMLEVLCPTMSFTSTELGAIPLDGDEVASSNAPIVDRMVQITKSDWDAYETSWDFMTLPLLSRDHHAETLEGTYTALRTHWQGMTDEMQRLEEENNRIFIDAYGLQDELDEKVPPKEITLTCNPAYSIKGDKTNAEREVDQRKRTMEEFLSYAVGCMFGRYSLDAPGLILANQGATLADYLARIQENEEEPQFLPDEDNVIPVLDDIWFEDDITDRFRLFLRTTFGETHFRENLRYIEDALSKDIRKYFTKDFYASHVQRYKKRPIYWMFSSPKGTFNALIYMHRYQSDTVSVLLNDYLREFITKLASERARLDRLADDSTATQAQKTKALKDAGAVAKQIEELNEWEREVIFPLAQKKIEIDLDDGVKGNYPMFGAALKKIVGVSE